jgi:hypothetical protein
LIDALIDALRKVRAAAVEEGLSVADGSDHKIGQ